MDIQLLFAPKVTGARFILRNVCAAEGYIPETEEEEEEEEKEGSSQDKKDDNSDEDDVDERELSWKRLQQGFNKHTTHDSRIAAEIYCKVIQISMKL